MKLALFLVCVSLAAHEMPVVVRRWCLAVFVLVLALSCLKGELTEDEMLGKR